MKLPTKKLCVCVSWEFVHWKLKRKKKIYYYESK